MDAGAREIMVALQVVAAVAQKYLANQGVLCPVANTSYGNEGGEINHRKRKPWKNELTSRKRRNLTRKARKAAATTTQPPPEPYLGTLPMCYKCDYHHVGACTVWICSKCQKKGHKAKYCWATDTQIDQVTIPTANTDKTRACYACGGFGHVKKNCPEVKHAVKTEPTTSPH